MIGDCLTAKCDQLQTKAAEVIENVSDRRIPADPNELILDPVKLLAKRFTGLEESVAFEKAAICMQECQLPLDITKRILSSNVRELELNLTNCVTACSVMTCGHDDELFMKEIFECKIECFEQNKSIMKELETELGRSLPQHKNSLNNLL